LCATLGAKLGGAGLIIAVDPIKERREMAYRFGASIALDPTATDAVDTIKRPDRWSWSGRRHRGVGQPEHV
jgi:threonine dehydrogenase-like Zn-dependent dehydrogenase